MLPRDLPEMDDGLGRGVDAKHRRVVLRLDLSSVGSSLVLVVMVCDELVVVLSPGEDV